MYIIIRKYSDHFLFIENIKQNRIDDIKWVNVKTV